MSRIWYDEDRLGNFTIHNTRDSRTEFIQVDYDRCGLASTFGWVPCCDATDGTVDCEHKTTTDHIDDATEFLREHEGDLVDDPGYFTRED